MFINFNLFKTDNQPNNISKNFASLITLINTISDFNQVAGLILEINLFKLYYKKNITFTFNKLKKVYANL